MGVLRPIAGKTDLLRAIGLVSVYHSLVQHELGDLLAVLLSVPTRHAQFLSSQVPFKKICAIIKGLALERMTDPVLSDELDVLLGRADRVDAARNGLLHSVWGVPLDLLFEKGAVRMKPKPQDMEHYEVCTPESVEKVADDLRAVADAIAYFWPKLSGKLRLP
jgi:hypothetical protein